MIIGIPRETMRNEKRVPLFPETIRILQESVKSRYLIFLAEHDLGREIGLSDADWRKAGALIVHDTASVYTPADLILKVKQPLEQELGYYNRRGQGVCCFHHVSANRNSVECLLQKGVVILPWESHPESLIAMSKEVGPRIVLLLEKLRPNWRQSRIFIGGARGTVGQHTILSLLSAGGSLNLISCCDVDDGFFVSENTGLEFNTFGSRNDQFFRSQIASSSIFILAAVTKNGAPRFIRRDHLYYLRYGALVIQVSIDEGGNIDNSACRWLTSWDNPVYAVRWESGNKFDVVNIPNFPGCVNADKSSQALVKANLPYYVEIISSWPKVPKKYVYHGSEVGVL